MHFRNIFLITRLGAIVTLTTEVIGRTLRRYAVGPAPVGRQELEGVERVFWVGGMLALLGPLAVPLEPRLPLLPRAVLYSGLCGLGGR